MTRTSGDTPRDAPARRCNGASAHWTRIGGGGEGARWPCRHAQRVRPARRRLSAPPRGLVLPAVLMLAGCGEPNLEALQGYIDTVKARSPQPLEPIPALPQVYTFVYEPGDRRDPFLMDDRTAEATMPERGTGVAPDPRRRREELEQYALESLRMVGTLEQHDTLWALIVSPDGLLHRVRVGNYLGRQSGQITQINPERIALTEIIDAGPGRWRERESEISLLQQ